MEFEQLAQLYERMAVRAARRDQRPRLGDVLYGTDANAGRPETDWVALVARVALQDWHAFRTLYLWTHRLVIAFIMAVTNQWSATEELSLVTFHGLWQGAGRFEPQGGTTVGWIMNQARVSARGGVHAADGSHGNSSAANQICEVMLDRPTEALPVSASLWGRIAERISAGAHEDLLPGSTEIAQEADWQQPAPGLSCRTLANDTQRELLSLLVRLAPGAEYPPHLHADFEQLYLLQGELRINDSTLYPGGYNCAAPNTADQRVWSERGCTCVLITSGRDILV